jgi:membrane-associated phospholipid phosphatase
MMCAWAALTSVSRVVMGRHYAGDVLAGALVGTLELLALRAAAPPMCAPWRRA